MSAEVIVADEQDARPAPARAAERPLRGTGARFLVSGAINTAIGFALLRALLYLYGDMRGAVAAAQATAYAFGIAISYVMNRRWTFRSDGTHGRELPRFVAAHLGALALSSALMQVGVSMLHLPLMVCFVLVTGLITVINFAAQRYWVFAPR